MSQRTTFTGHAIVACGTLRRELSCLRESGFLDAERVLLTGPGLHAKPEELKVQLQRQLARAEDACDRVIVVYGSKCYLDLDDPTTTVDSFIPDGAARRVRAESCIDMLADASEREELAEGQKVLWLSPGWIDHWKRIYQQYLGWDAADANMNFPGYYSKAIMLDPVPLGLFERWTAEEPERILEFSDWTHLPVESRPVTLDRLKALLAECAQPEE